MRIPEQILVPEPSLIWGLNSSRTDLLTHVRHLPSVFEQRDQGDELLELSSAPHMPRGPAGPPKQ